MSGYRRNVADVTRWPDSPDAKAALEEWFATPAKTTSYLSGDFLDFRGSDLSGMDLTGAYLVGACMVGVRFVDAFLGSANLNNSDLRDADLSHADLTKAEMVGCAAVNACFRGARMFAAVLDEAGLSHADLRDTILNSAKLYETDLQGADLRGASMRWCTLGGKSMPALLSGARMFGCHLEGAKGVVVGPVAVDEQGTLSLDGADLESWFLEQGAENIRVVPKLP